MASATWEEIRRLASDFQRVQLGESAKRLSERNCIELILSLKQDHRIDIVYCTDGKEFVTKDYLMRQIKDEVIGNGGRVTLTDLQDALNVEYQHIEDAAQMIIQEEPDDYQVVVGQLLSTDYVYRICKEINDWLMDEGLLNLGQITKHYDLPSDFLRDRVFKSIGSIIQGVRDQDDPQMLYTQMHICEQRQLLRGALNALTTPTALTRIVSEHGLQTGLVLQSFDWLKEQDHLNGSLSGGRIVDRATYIPEAYRAAMLAWVRNFYEQNGYVEFSAVRKLGWPDDVASLIEANSGSKRSGMSLSSCYMKLETWVLARDAILDALNGQGWADVGAILPNYLTEDDAKQMIKEIIDASGGRKKSDINICDDVFAYKESLLSKVGPLFAAEIEEKAAIQGSELMKKAVEKKLDQGSPTKDVNVDPFDDDNGDTVVQSKRKGKGRRGGAGGKKDKGKGNMGNSQTSSTAVAKPGTLVTFMTEEEISDTLQGRLNKDCPDSILKDLSERLKPVLDSKFREAVESIFLSSEAANKSIIKKSHSEFANLFRVLIQNIYLYDIGTNIFPENIGSQLRASLLRSLCVDAANLAAAYLGGLPLTAKLTAKNRQDILNDLSSEQQPLFDAWLQSLTKSKDDLTQFFDTMGSVTGSSLLDVGVRFPDKKSRQAIIAEHISQMSAQIEQTTDPAECLLLVFLLLLVKTTDNLVHATGKFVPQLAAVVLPKLDNSEFVGVLQQTQKLVVQKLSTKHSHAGDVDDLNERLTENISFIKSASLKL